MVGCFGLLSNFVGLLLFHDDGHGHGHSHGGLDVEDGTIGSGHSHESGHQHSHLNNGLDDQTDSEFEPDSIQDMLPYSVVERTLSRKSKDDSDEITGLLNDPSNNNNGSSAKKASQRSMNMHGVFLHVLGDALGNIGVIATALFIWKSDYSWRFYTDPAVSLFISLIIFSSAIPLSLKASFEDLVASDSIKHFCR